MLRILVVAAACLLFSLPTMSMAQDPDGTIVNYGSSTDGVNWTFESVFVPDDGYVAVFIGGELVYIFGDNYNGPMPTGEGDALCWCSVGYPPGQSICKCGNYCAINGVQGQCSIPY